MNSFFLHFIDPHKQTMRWPLALCIHSVALFITTVSLSTSQIVKECIASTRKDRASLFHHVLRATLRREAFSSIKNKRLGLNVTETMLNEKDAFLSAETDEELYYSLVRMSNARKDRHLSVRPASKEEFG